MVLFNYLEKYEDGIKYLNKRMKVPPVKYQTESDDVKDKSYVAEDRKKKKDIQIESAKALYQNELLKKVRLYVINLYSGLLY